MESIKKKYERRKSSYIKLLEKQKKAEKEISLIRLLVFLIGVNIGIYTYITHKRVFFYINLIVFLTIFIYLVKYHKRLIQRIRYSTLLKDINIKFISRLEGDWDTFKDDGHEFKDDDHNYLLDLDIFGNRSLFQWINTAITFKGRYELRILLSRINGEINDILKRQEAVIELSKMLKWRQRLIAEGTDLAEAFADPKDLIYWANNENKTFKDRWNILFIRLMPCITITLIITSFIMHKVTWHFPILALIIQFLIISYKGYDRHQLLNLSEKYNRDLRAYYNMLKLLEQHRFDSKYIVKIKDELKGVEGIEAYKQIDGLTSIINSISNRRNSFYTIFNVITLWDLQTIIALEKWKDKSGKHLEGWLDSLGKIEALSSLAVIGYDNPNWVFPSFVEGKEEVLDAKDIGHPLITKNRVNNNISINKKTKVMLITGSNMSGKSTLLRTAGINLVLAYAGAPVCASNFNASLMNIYTCMRVTDNLSENISSFYAELLRIKRIVSVAETGRSIFFLLDEIFKGTNSLDRHTGAKVLINKLSQTNAIGMVSTHDLELCELERENKKIENYHFQEYYKNDKIYFDYKLRTGASKTRNALYLMKLAGIDVD